MPKLKAGALPKLRRHVARRKDGSEMITGVVTLAGQDHYLGDIDDPACEARYGELVARWLAGNRKPLRKSRATELTVADLVGRYEDHVRAYYRKRGELTSHGRVALRALRVLGKLYGTLPIAEFDRDCFQVVRNHWVATPNQYAATNSRATVNKMAECVRVAFRWGAEEARLVPASVWAEVALSRKLRKGRTAARETPRVGVAPPDSVAVVRLAMRADIRAMIDLQLATGMRPGEACGLAGGMIDRRAEPWIYRVPPEINKNAHKGKDRAVALGPQARAILRPFLDRQPDPATPLFRTRSGVPYKVAVYGSVVRAACLRLRVVRWTPNMLRHSAATEIRRRSGLEAAQVILGHSQASMTETYAEVDVIGASRVVEEFG